MLKKFSLFLFTFIFVIGFASAELAILGTVYGDGFGGSLSDGALVLATCDATLVPNATGLTSVTETQVTGADGVFALLFDSDTQCIDGSEIKISYSKAGFDTFNGERIIDYSTISNTGSIFIIVADHALVPSVTPPSGGGGGATIGGGSSSGGGSDFCISEFFNCGEWEICSEGEQTRICISNCGTIRTELQSCGEEVIDLLDEGSEVGFTPLEGAEEDFQAENFFSRITGAVVGTLGTGGSFIAAVFVALVIAGFVFTRMKVEEDGKLKEE